MTLFQFLGMELLRSTFGKQNGAAPFFLIGECDRVESFHSEFGWRTIPFKDRRRAVAWTGSAIGGRRTGERGGHLQAGGAGGEGHGALTRVGDERSRSVVLSERLVPHIRGIFPCWSRPAPQLLNQTPVKMEPLHSISIHPTNQTHHYCLEDKNGAA
jgi:hypothetical protein